MLDKLREANAVLVAHVPLFLGIAIVIGVPMAVVEIYLVEAVRDPLQLFFVSVASAVFSFGLWTLGMAATVQALARFESGDRIGLGKTFKDALEVWHSVAWTWLVTWLIIGLGFVCFILPGIYLLVKYAFVPHIQSLEDDLNGGEARKRSWHLTDGHGWQIAGVYALFFIPIWFIKWYFNLTTAATYGNAQFLRVLLEVVQTFLMMWPFATVFKYYWVARAKEEDVDVPYELVRREQDVRLVRTGETGVV